MLLDLEDLVVRFICLLSPFVEDRIIGSLLMVLAHRSQFLLLLLCSLFLPSAAGSAANGLLQYLLTENTAKVQGLGKKEDEVIAIKISKGAYRTRGSSISLLPHAVLFIILFEVFNELFLL